MMPIRASFTGLSRRLNGCCGRKRKLINKGCLIIDDSTLDKFYSRKIELVNRHWSGKHKRVVSGINLVTMLWTDDERHIPVD
ncbi:hypothetical protein VU08_06020, partial [Desulfobulbus sp. F5]|nr:hypothetical protein [Desulfobulbus sp. F5]